MPEEKPQDPKPMGYEELGQIEQQMIDDFNRRYRSLEYQRVFYTDGPEWKLEASFVDSFYRSAKFLLEGVLDGKLSEADGVAAVFLCRHYLELALKYILFHSRWLKDETTNASNEGIEAIKNDHDLADKWNGIATELKSRTPSICKQGLDIEFVGHFVREFHQVDATNWRFRYPTKTIKVTSRRAGLPSLGIDFEALLYDLEHAHEVLEGLDSYLVETHGQNEEWESIRNDI